MRAADLLTDRTSPAPCARWGHDGRAPVPPAEPDPPDGGVFLVAVRPTRKALGGNEVGRQKALLKGLIRGLGYRATSFCCPRCGWPGAGRAGV